MTESESTWLISAFQLTFASFLLIVSASTALSTSATEHRTQSGKISDVYNPSEFLLISVVI
jgi:hypothetical protein